MTDLVTIRSSWLAVCLATAVAITVLAPASAAAHRTPGSRSVVAQVDSSSLVLLVAWKPPSGPLADSLSAMAKTAGAERQADRLRSLYASRAVGPLQVRLDGQVATPTATRVKLVEDPVGSGRLAVVAMVEFALPAATFAIEIRNSDTKLSRFMWLDRSGDCFVSQRVDPGRRWLHQVASVLLVKRPTCLAGLSSTSR